jgi:hypothetical protein
VTPSAEMDLPADSLVTCDTAKNFGILVLSAGNFRPKFNLSPDCHDLRHQQMSQ